ncbi:DNA helicase [Tanacetum coccineum]
MIIREVFVKLLLDSFGKLSIRFKGELHENTEVREILFLYCYAFSVSLLLTPLCCDDIHDVTPRVFSLAGYYIGCIRAVSGIEPFGNPNERQGVRRKIDIENLNGNIIELTLWDEMEEHFEKADREKMEQPVIIAVSSCRVSKYRDYQLAATSATYYYLNPIIPEAEESRALSGTAPLTFFTPAADKLTSHPCAELVKKYDPTDQNKIPPEVLVVQGKSSIFQFHYNSLANTTDLTLDEVFSPKSQDQTTSTSANPTTASSPVAATIPESMKDQEHIHKEKENTRSEQEPRGTPPPSPNVTAHTAKILEEAGQKKEKIAKRNLFQQPSTNPKKQKGD